MATALTNGRTGEPRIWALCLVGALYWVANSAMKPVVALVGAGMGLSPAVIGLVISGQALLPLFLAIPAGVLADRYGARRVLIVGGAGMVAAGGCFMAATSPFLLFLAQTVLGISQVVVWLCVQALVTHGEAHGRQRQIDSFTFALSIGQLAGPVLGTGLLERGGSNAVFLGYLGVSAALVLGALFTPHDQVTGTLSQAADAGQGTLAKSKALLLSGGMQVTLLTTFLMLYLTDLRNTFIPLYLQQVGYPPTRIGVIISIGAAAAVGVRLATTFLMSRFGERWTLAIGAAMGIAGTVVTPLLSGFWWLALASAIGGFGTGLNQPLTIGLIARTTPSHLRGLGMGLRLTANRAAQLVNPILFGALLQLAGNRPAFFASGALLSGIGLLIVYRYPSEAAASS